MLRQAIFCRRALPKTWTNTRSFLGSPVLPGIPSQQHVRHVLTLQRQISTAVNDQKSSTEALPYNGPLASTFRRLKLFSVSSFALSCTLAPFMFIVESNLPMTARIALASIAIGTSGTSTALVGWCGKPYVSTLRRLEPETIEMTTLDLLLHPRITTVYDPAFLVETKRAFAKWELAETLVLPASKSIELGKEETVAETRDKEGNVLGKWVVEWGEGGKGTCHEVGSIIRYFNVHEELL